MCVRSPNHSTRRRHTACNHLSAITAASSTTSIQMAVISSGSVRSHLISSSSPRLPTTACPAATNSLTDVFISLRRSQSRLSSFSYTSYLEQQLRTIAKSVHTHTGHPGDPISPPAPGVPVAMYNASSPSSSQSRRQDCLSAR